MILADISIPPRFLLKLNLSVRRVGLTKTKTNTLSLRGLFWLQIWFMHSHNQVITVNRSAFFCFFLFFKTHFLPLTCFFVMASFSLSSPRFPPPSSSFAAVKPLFCFSLSLPRRTLLLSPLFPVPCYSISGIYLSYIIFAALQHLPPTCVLSVSFPLPLAPTLILICILAIQLNRPWLCNELTSHFSFSVFMSVHAGKEALPKPYMSRYRGNLNAKQADFKTRLLLGFWGLFFLVETPRAHTSMAPFCPPITETAHHSCRVLRRGRQSLVTLLRLSWLNLCSVLPLALL